MTRRSIKKNLAYNIFYQMVGILTPLFTSPYLSRVLGVDNLGIHSYTMSIAIYFMMFILLGIGNYGNRTIAKLNISEKDKIEETFWSIYLFQFIMAILVISLYFIYVSYFVTEYKTIAFIQVFLVLSNAVDITWYFYGKEDFKLIVIRNTLVKVIGLFSIFLFVKSEQDLWKYTFLNGGIAFLGQLVIWKQLFEQINFRVVSLKKIFPHIKHIFLLFIPVLAISIFTNMDKSMLGIYSQISQVGFYENANKIIEIPKSLIAALGAVMLPRTAALIAEGKEEESKKYIEITILYTMMLSSALMFGLMAVADTFSVVFWGKEFLESGKLIKMMAPAFVFSVFGNIIRTQYLIPRSKDKDYILSLVIGAIINFIINLFLIPKYGAIGASIATVIAEFVMTFIQSYVVRKEIKILGYLKNGYIFYLFGLIMYIIINLIKQFLAENIISLILLIVVGVISFGMMTIIYLYLSPNFIFMPVKYFFKNTFKKRNNIVK